MINKIVRLCVLPVMYFIAFIGCDKREQNIAFPAAITDNVAEVATKSGLNTFAAAFKAARFDTAFDYLGQYTVFAPTDAAFTAAGINAGNLNAIPIEVLRGILRNHILPGRTTALSFLPGPNAVYGNINRDFIYTSTYLSTTPGVGSFAGVYFNGIKIVNVDLLANNGVIHTLDGLLLPAGGNLTTTLAANPNLSFLNAAIARAGLTTTLNTGTAAITLLAPNNAAFIAAGFPDIATINAASPTTLSAILRLHVIPATGATATAGRLFSPDFRAGNYTTLNGTIATTVSGTIATFRGAGNTGAGAVVLTPNVLFRSLIASGAPSVLHIVDRVLLP